MPTVLVLAKMLVDVPATSSIVPMALFQLVSGLCWVVSIFLLVVPLYGK